MTNPPLISLIKVNILVLVFGQRALQVYPDCPGAVRLGIAHCHYKLGHFGKACLAFQRVLQVSDMNICTCI